MPFARLPSRTRTAELEREVAQLRAERDRLAGRLAAQQRADDLDFVFVLTYGRAGSTLVQGILNAIPGYLIRGENRQLLRLLWEYETKGMHWRRHVRRKQRKAGTEVGASDATAPLFGMDGFPVRRMRASARRMAVDTILRPEPDTRVSGFKEIEWGEEDTPDYVAWLREVFPGARFVVNTRDLSSVAQSAWWSKDPGAAEELRRREAMLIRLRDELGDAAFHIRYDEFTADPASLRGLFEWLGEEFDEDAVRKVLAVEHSYQPAWMTKHDDSKTTDGAGGATRTAAPPA